MIRGGCLIAWPLFAVSFALASLLYNGNMAASCLNVQSNCRSPPHVAMGDLYVTRVVWPCSFVVK